MNEDPEIPVVCGRFVLEEQIGSGAMGMVWRARDTLLERAVAVKQLQLPPDGRKLTDPEVRRGLLREARAAARLNHPAVVTVYDAVLHDDDIFIVMELVCAPTLLSAIHREGSLSPARVAGIGLQLVDVLQDAHRIGLTHRDIKPSNLMLLPGDRVKVTDFGIARIAGEPHVTAHYVLRGSPAYMAPEQIRDTTGSSFPSADWWSLAVSLHHAVEGELPFPQSTAVAVIAAILTEEPRSPRRACPELGVILRAMMAKDPDERPGIDTVRAAFASVARSIRPVKPADAVDISTDVLRPDQDHDSSTTSWYRCQELLSDASRRVGPVKKRAAKAVAGIALICAVMAVPASTSPISRTSPARTTTTRPSHTPGVPPPVLSDPQVSSATTSITVPTQPSGSPPFSPPNGDVTIPVLPPGPGGGEPGPDGGGGG